MDEQPKRNKRGADEKLNHLTASRLLDEDKDVELPPASQTFASKDVLSRRKIVRARRTNSSTSPYSTPQSSPARGLGAHSNKPSIASPLTKNFSLNQSTFVSPVAKVVEKRKDVEEEVFYSASKGDDNTEGEIVAFKAGDVVSKDVKRHKPAKKLNIFDVPSFGDFASTISNSVDTIQGDIKQVGSKFRAKSSIHNLDNWEKTRSNNLNRFSARTQGAPISKPIEASDKKTESEFIRSIVQLNRKTLDQMQAINRNFPIYDMTGAMAAYIWHASKLKRLCSEKSCSISSTVQNQGRQYGIDLLNFQPDEEKCQLCCQNKAMKCGFHMNRYGLENTVQETMMERIVYIGTSENYQARQVEEGHGAESEKNMKELEGIKRSVLKAIEPERNAEETPIMQNNIPKNVNNERPKANENATAPPLSSSSGFGGNLSFSNISSSSKNDKNKESANLMPSFKFPTPADRTSEGDSSKAIPSFKIPTFGATTTAGEGGSSKAIPNFKIPSFGVTTTAGEKSTFSFTAPPKETLTSSETNTSESTSSKATFSFPSSKTSVTEATGFSFPGFKFNVPKTTAETVKPSSEEPPKPSFTFPTTKTQEASKTESKTSGSAFSFSPATKAFPSFASPSQEVSSKTEEISSKSTSNSTITSSSTISGSATPIFRSPGLFSSKNVSENDDKKDSEAGDETEGKNRDEKTKNTFSFGEKAEVSGDKSKISFNFGQNLTPAFPQDKSQAPVTNLFTQFSSASSTPSFSFGFKPAEAKSAETSGETKESEEPSDDEPPKPVETNHAEEEDAVWTEKARLHYFKKAQSKYEVVGLGKLHLKQTNGKCQAILRAEQALGNVILNIVMDKIKNKLEKQAGRKKTVTFLANIGRKIEIEDEENAVYQFLMTFSSEKIRDEFLEKVEELTD